ncbi:heme exporter protein CcmD [Marinobacter excellens]|jgi:heme exporter protein D|uniref:Heme exporter protein D n=2 Tax=Marinobacter TaxID=2742 RepID=A0A137SCS5_9GAMM|nr:heme exporter protein CcmD [Marinobacter excellens]KXO10251.1 Cytochrome c-type biogenesis protein CcmD, interacts with CcmCE [Marinobacter excellens LAMA 842]
MAFDSFSAFMAMEGHGPYVWVCYAVFAVLLGGLMIWSVKRNRVALEDCQRRHETESRASARAPGKASATFTRVEIPQD